MFYVKLLENKSIGVFGFKYFDISQGDAFDWLVGFELLLVVFQELLAGRICLAHKYFEYL
jgi:hypothetical protein